MNAPEQTVDRSKSVGDLDRKIYLGGSDAAAALGLSKYRSPYQVYLAKVGELQSGEMDPQRRLFLERRKRWEPVVRQMLQEELDVEIVAFNQRYSDKEHPYFAAELDFEWRDEDGSIQNGEIKTVHPRAYGERFGWGEKGSGDIPIEYEAQVQHGLGILPERRVTIVPVLIGLDDMIFYRVERNDSVITEMRTRLSAFWTNHVLARVAPDPTTVLDLSHLFPTSNEGFVEAAPAVAEAALRLRAIKSQSEALEAEADALEFAVKRAMGSAGFLTVGGKKIFSWKESPWAMLDQSALKENEPAIWKQYQRKGRRRVFRKMAWTTE